LRWKQAFIQTYREEPRDAEATSHRLMLRGSLIRKLSSGVYNYLPLGYRSLRKVMAIIREEMNRAGATELFLPSLHPAELWKATGRYEALGDDLLSLKNRAGTEFVLGPTHEEVVTQIVSESVKSYKDLPFTLYQIQVKFRDEARPRYGVIRSKEFLMKDAYSFDRDEQGLDASYNKMRKAYQEIFRRVGLDILEVSADPGMMGGKVSHEFMVRDPFGEDKIASCAKCSSLTSLEIASCKVSAAPSEKPQKMESFSTPNLKTIEELEKNFQIPKEKLLKSIVYVADEKPVVVCLRGDHEVNETKLKKLLKVERCELADAEKIEKVTGAPVGFTGPVGLKKIKIVLDASADGECNWVTGANQKDKHLKNVNLGRDFQAEIKGDIRYATETDLCAECGGALKIETALEMGHIFKLGTRYSKPLKAQYLDEQGKKTRYSDGLLWYRRQPHFGCCHRTISR